MDASELVGERVAARYTIEAVLGTGGMANVYRAFDDNLQRHVALKIFTEPSEEIKRRFLAEARSLARLNHPAIVSVYDGAEDAGRSFIVMEIADGEDLRAWRDRGASFGFLIGAVASVLDALAFAHERDILHRDVKPSNIFVNAEGRVKLMDFGLSRRISDLSAGTQAGEIVGTVAYLPPERFLGKASDARGDLYSIGIVLYELITGFAPFRSDSDDLVAIVFAHLNERPVPPRKAGAAIDDELERLVMRLLEKDPSARFESANVGARRPAGLPGPPSRRGGRGAGSADRWRLAPRRRSAQEPSLRRSVTPWGSFSWGYSDVGADIFVGLGLVLGAAAGASNVAFLFAGLVYVCIGLAYTELAAAYPVAGGGQYFVFRGLGDIFGFIAGWAVLLDFTIDIVLFAWSCIDYLSKLVPILSFTQHPWVHFLVVLSIIVFLALLNIIGVRESSAFNELVSGLDVVSETSILFFGFLFAFQPQL